MSAKGRPERELLPLGGMARSAKGAPMSAPGRNQDVHASGAKPRLGERVCEHGRRPTLDRANGDAVPRRALRRARRRAIAAADALTLHRRQTDKEAG